MAKTDRDVTDLDEAAQLLYGEAQAEFVSRRDALAKELRAAGSAELAAEVKTLRKPSNVAAEINRIVRSETDAVAALIDAASALRASQDEVLAGGSADLSVSRAAYRAAIADVVRHATRDHVRVAAALEAAAADPAYHARLRAGTFAAEPEPAVGFGSFPTAGDSQTSVPLVTETTTDPPPTKRQLTAAVRAAEKALSASDRRVREAEKTLGDATSAADELDARVASLESQLAETRTDQAEARKNVAAAQAAAEQATFDQEEARRHLERAQQQLAQRE